MRASPCGWPTRIFPQCAADPRGAAGHGRPWRVRLRLRRPRVFRDAICWWQSTHHGWQVDPDWIIPTQGLGHAIGMILDTYTGLGDGVCFFHAGLSRIPRKDREGRASAGRDPHGAGRRPLRAGFRRSQGRDGPIREGPDLLRAAEPLGPRFWTGEEMRAVAEFAARHDLIVVSDEIHSDLIYPGAKHVPMAKAAPEHAGRIITINAASKTFGIPGLSHGLCDHRGSGPARGLSAADAHDRIQPRNARDRGHQGRLFPPKARNG